MLRWIVVVLLVLVLPVHGAGAQTLELLGAADASGREVAPGTVTCAAPSSGRERISAIYLDLQSAALAGSYPTARVRSQEWLCSGAQSGAGSLLGVGRAAVTGTGLAGDPISTGPSAVTATVASAQGEIWEIELADLAGVALEAGAFASDRASFFINAIEWDDDGLLAVLDADFEVELGAALLRGRVLWNAPETPDEDPFVPLYPDDREQAQPGGISVTGLSLERLFAATLLALPPSNGGAVQGGVPFPPDGSAFSGMATSGITTGGIASTSGDPLGPERMDSIRYSADLPANPAAARAEVAADVARLFEEQAGAAPPPSDSSAGRTRAAAGRSRLLPNAAAQPATGAGGPPSLSTGLGYPSRVAEPTRFAASTGAGIAEREPGWLAHPAPPPGEAPDRAGPRGTPDRALEAQRPEAQTSSRRGSASGPNAAGRGNPELRDPEAAPLESGSSGGAGELQDGSTSLAQLLAVWWGALRALADWLLALSISEVGS